MAAAGPVRQPLLASNQKISTNVSQIARSSLLLASLLLNVVVALVLLLPTTSYTPSERDLSIGESNVISSSSVAVRRWSDRAAAEAERAAAIRCSGHGKVFVDTHAEANGETSCECNRCFVGTDCSSRIQDCEANVDSGDPLYLEPFWDANAEAGALVVPPSYRMSYSVSFQGSILWNKASSFELQRVIREVHEFVGNAVVKDKFIVIGTGSMQLINAAVASLAPETNSLSPAAVVVSQAPYYQAYQSQTEFFASTQYVWGGEPSVAARRYANTGASFIEFVAAPNNPDSSMKDPALNGSFAVLDRAYYWPHYSPIYKAMDDDVMFFTLSKLTGHAGSRLGWAIIKDPKVFERMSSYVLTNTLGVSHDTQLRATRLLRAVLEGYRKAKPDLKATASAKSNAESQQIFHFGHSVMSSRWQKLIQLFSKTKRFSLQTVVDHRPCNFFKTTILPSPAYAWVKCEELVLVSNSTCLDVFKEAGIIGRAGGYGDDRDKFYVRFALLIGNDDFDNFVEHLAKFLA